MSTLMQGAPRADKPTTHPRYLTYVCRGWTKDSLAMKIDDVLKPYATDEIVSIVYQDQPLYIFGRRNSALITVLRADE